MEEPQNGTELGGIGSTKSVELFSHGVKDQRNTNLSMDSGVELSSDDLKSSTHWGFVDNADSRRGELQNGDDLYKQLEAEILDQSADEEDHKVPNLSSHDLKDQVHPQDDTSKSHNKSVDIKGEVNMLNEPSQRQGVEPASVNGDAQPQQVKISASNASVEDRERPRSPQLENNRDSDHDLAEVKKTDDLFNADMENARRAKDPPSTQAKYAANKVVPISTQKAATVTATDNNKSQKGKEKKKCKIKCAKNYRQIAAEKTKKAMKGAAGMATGMVKDYVKDALPEPLAAVVNNLADDQRSLTTPEDGRSYRDRRCELSSPEAGADGGKEDVDAEKSASKESSSDAGKSNRRDKKKCKIKCSKTYKQVIQEQSKKAAKFAVKRAQAAAMTYAGAYVPQPMMQKINNKLAERGVISPYSPYSPSSPHRSSSRSAYRSPSPYSSEVISPYLESSIAHTKRSKIKATKMSRIKSGKRKRSASKRKEDEKSLTGKDSGGEEDEWSEEEIKIVDAEDESNAVDTQTGEVKEKQVKSEDRDGATEKTESIESVQNKQNETIRERNAERHKRHSERKSRCVSTSRRVNEKPDHDMRYSRRRHRKEEEKKKEPILNIGGMGGGGDKGFTLTSVIDGASKCTSVSGIAKTVAPKLVNGVLGNSRLKKAWTSGSSRCACCKCCSKCSSHCDACVKIFLSIVSIAVVAYDVAMAWTAFAGYYRFEGSSPLTIVFGIVCSIASILMLLEVRNAIMSCLVNIIKVKRFQKVSEQSSIRKKIIAEEYWIEIVSLLELLLGDVPIVIILALTITFASCGLYNATFRKGIVGKLALYAVCISALWKAIMSCVQFCMSKPFRKNAQGKRRVAWTLFRMVRPLVALVLLFFALYIILNINGIYINLMSGRDEMRLDCRDQ